jgi:hypothetical protein
VNVIHFLHSMRNAVKAWRPDGSVFVRLEVLDDNQSADTIVLVIHFQSVVQPFTLDAKDCSDADALVREVMGLLKAQYDSSPD